MPRDQGPSAPSEGGAREAPEPFPPLDLDTFLAAPPPDPDWDWRGWYARGDVVLEAGDPGVGKSLVNLAAAVTAARGGGELLDEPIAARRVLLFDLESPEDVVYTRLYALGLRGRIAGLDYVHRPAGFNLLDSDCLAQLRETIARAGATLVVIDSLRRAAPGLDENDSRQVSILLTALRTIAAEHRCTIVIIHHPRKPVGDAKVEALYAARGSGDLIGSVDSYLFFRRLGDGLVRIEHGKARRGREHEDVHFRIIEDDDGHPLLEPVTPRKIDEEELDARVLEHVTAHPGASTKEVEEAVGGRRETVRKSLERGASNKLLAPGPGRHPRGKYWYPAGHAALQVAPELWATPGDTSPDLSRGTGIAPLAPPLKGGRRGDTVTGDDGRDDDWLATASMDEVRAAYAEASPAAVSSGEPGAPPMPREGGSRP